MASGSTSDRVRLVSDGCLHQHALVCGVCGEEIQPGADVHCSDGYDRVYGEFVLSELSDMYENNWPSVHVACGREADSDESGASSTGLLPRAVVVTGDHAVRRMSRLRLMGAACLGTSLAVAGAAVYFAGVAAGAFLVAGGAALTLVGWGVAHRLRSS